ncbi:hypothetical protein [Paracoccus spongiarum]|uniref:Uncharacterized protein n=1 Tax=Paracoccus spongiarum TaxID=3064387 RepID=A0ABT9JAA3_9RHOB|nr:hypothetical protein [Paracoccus sp. 2205BS29-5]MDP5306734.1 hypothetical protein [Paracoccus sp. 2205BS29-5]
MPVNDQGPDARAGLAPAPDFGLTFVTPACPHPLGSTMSAERRPDRLRAAETAGPRIVEGDVVGDVPYGGHALPPRKNIDRAGRAIPVGTFSKALSPPLRLG